MMVAPNPFEWILLILLGGGFGLSPSAPPAEEAPLAAKVAPAECLFYASWAATGTPDAKSANQTEQLLAEKEIQKFLVEGRERMFGYMTQFSRRQPEAQENIKLFTKLLDLIRGKAGALYITDLKFGRFGPSHVEGGALLQLGDQTAETTKLIEKLQSKLPKKEVSTVKIGSRSFHRIKSDKDAPSVTWGVLDDNLVLGIGDGSLEKLIKRSQGEAPGWLTDIRKQLTVPRVSSVSYLNMNQLMGLVFEQDKSGETKTTLSALGISPSKLNYIASVSGMDDKGCVTRAMLSVKGEKTGLLKWMNAKPLTADDLAPVGSDVLGAVVLKLNAAQLFELWLSTAEQINPQAGQMMKAQFDAMGAHLGFDIRDDFLKSIGDTWRVFIQPTGPTAIIHGWTLVTQLKDPEKFKEVNKLFVEMLQQQLAHGGGNTPELTTGRKIKGQKVYTLDFEPLGAPFAPSWCITDKEFILAATLDTLEKYLEDSNRKSLAKQPTVAPLVAKDAQTLAMVYIDTHEFAETILPRVPELFQAMVPGAPRFDTSLLPSSKIFAAHLQPTVFSVQRVKDGLELTHRRTLPGADIGTMAPTYIGFMLPAVSAARGAARRARGMNNLKQLGVALHNFESMHGAFPAGYSADKKGKPLLSWRVRILPMLEQQDLYDQFHLDEPWDSPHNKKLIEKMPDVFRSPASKNKKPGMTNYLGVGGADGIFVRPEAGGNLGTRIRDITDGTSHTIMVVEVPDKSAVIWTKPADFAPDKKDPTKGLVGLHVDVFQAGFTDGSVRVLNKDIDADVFRALLTKSGGEVVDHDKF